jgi:glycosyltransferase involved in cell wall biosynthesis
LLKLCGDVPGAVKAYREAFALADDDGAAAIAAELAFLKAVPPRPSEIRFDHRPLIVDVTDLVNYSNRFDRPTGIQRVQLGVVEALLAETNVGRSLALVKRENSGQWVHVTSLAIKQLSERLCGAGIQARTDVVEPGMPLNWPHAASYLMLGTAWDDAVQYQALGALKQTKAIQVASFIHDLVPVQKPALTVPGLKGRFEAWLKEALPITDRWISNSEFTAAQLVDFAKSRQYPVPVVGVAPLNARLSSARDPAAIRRGIDEVAKHLAFDPPNRPFVLAVGTVEPRKNYETLVAAWREVCAAVPSPPVLVIVGRIGWSAARTMKAIERARADGVDIRHASHLSDDALDALYSYCDFTVYPSVMEGWGLPVTESLVHGKIPVVGHHSGILEAASEFGYYVKDIGSARLLAEALHDLIVDVGARIVLESNIKSNYRVRSRADLAMAIIDHAVR